VVEPDSWEAQTPVIVAVAADVVGRDAEVASLDELLADVPAALELLGQAGIGKTTLVRHAVEQAHRFGFFVLQCCPSAPESELAYAAFGDLLQELPRGIVDSLPAPQQRAFDAVQLVDEGAVVDDRARALGLGFLNAVAALSRNQPVLLVLDDVQWVDPPSAAALEFALRRLRGEAVAMLLCGREEPAWLRRALATVEHERVGLGPLSPGATHRIVHDRLGISLPWPTLRRLHHVAGGNPFFALELARTYSAAASSTPLDELPLPKSLQEVAEARIGALGSDTIEVLTITAAAAAPTLSLLRAVGGEGGLAALGPAVGADVVVVAGERVDFTHPLLAAAVLSRSAPHARQSVHRRLADAVRNPEERARHLAASTSPPDENVAVALEAAAAVVAARGAPDQGAQLAELSARFTPDHDAGASRRRRLSAAGLHDLAGGWKRGNELLVALASELEAGPERAEVLLHLSTGLQDDVARYEQALVEAGGATPVTGQLHRSLAYVLFFLGNLTRARQHIRTAIVEFEGGNPGSLALALGAHILFETFAGEPVDDLVIRRALGLEQESLQPPAMHSPSKSVGHRQLQCGFVEEAWQSFTGFQQACLEHGNEGLSMNALWQLSEAACGLGRLELAAELAEESLEAADQIADPDARMCSLLRVGMAYAHLGRSDEAIAEATESRRLALADDNASFAVRNLTTIAFVELSRGDAEGAWTLLEPLPDQVAAMGHLGPSFIPVLPLAAEAAALANHLDEAALLNTRLDTVARHMTNPWALAWAARVRGLVCAGGGDFAAALAAFDEAAVVHAGISAHFDEARTILARGMVERRAKRWAEARASLELAQERFEQFGAQLWAERAREELSRVSGRKRSETRLTATERRIAERVAQGASNKQVAAALFVSVKAVEVTLTRVYAKLGVRSRTELAHRFDELNL
jgi:DNA-binding CsgD family transcriptional regulator